MTVDRPLSFSQKLITKDDKLLFSPCVQIIIVGIQNNNNNNKITHEYIELII